MVVLVLVIGLSTGLSLPAFSAVVRVPADYGTIREAVEAASPGDTVLVAPGSYTDPYVIIDKSLILLSEGGREVTVLDGFKITILQPDIFNVIVRIWGFTFTASQETPIRLQTHGTTRFLSLDISDCRFVENGGVSAYGGALDVSVVSSVYTELNIHDCIFERNTCTSWGGAINIHGLLSGAIADNIFVGNESPQRGGAIACTRVNEFAGGPPHYRIERNQFFDNTAAFEGGAIAMWAGSRFLLLSGNTFQGNRAGLHGGAVAVFNQSGSIEISDNLMVENQATDLGGALAIIESAAIASNNTIDRNAGARGAGIAVYVPHVMDFLYRNIVTNATNGSGIFYVGDGSDLTTACNDAWENAGGEYEGFVPTSTDFSLDPEYCNPSLEDYTLAATSPCTSENSPAGCELIGAFPVGCATTEVAPEGGPPPASTLLVSPNPSWAKGLTSLSFVLSRRSPVDLVLIQPSGRIICRLTNGIFEPGTYESQWDGRNESGLPVPSGTYFCVLVTSEGEVVRKLTILR
jgi:hypothetical protein